MAIIIDSGVEHFNAACSICQVKLTPEKATAGLLDANNQQVFACVSHLSEVELLIVGWANFLATERQRYEQRMEETNNLIYGGSNAWFDS